MRSEIGFGITPGKVSRTDRQISLSGNTALHENVEIKCFYEGTATLLIESQTVRVKAGDVVVINPYEFHATVDTGEEKGKYHLFMLPLDYFCRVFKAVTRKSAMEYLRSFRLQIANFIDAIRAGRPLAVTPANGCRAVALIEDIYRFSGQ